MSLLGFLPCFAVTPPTLISHDSSVYNANAASRSVTPASGWQAADVIVVVAVDEGAASESFNTPTASGLTFTNVINHAASSDPALLISTATAAGSGSGPITVTLTATRQFGMSVYVFRGSDGIGNNASQFTSSRTVNLTPTAADSAVVWAVGDWAAAVVQSPTPTPTNADVAVRSTSIYTVYVDELTDQSSAGTTAYGIGGSGTGPFSIGAIEIKGAAGGGGSPAAGVSKRQKLQRLDLLP